eukprot:TRINITY_DN15240_c0_g3_i1.p2 TRINITY_DN15240_c0_g3~~TRINITY_DN15240_c0_g3_i1.p2  ORF type:complete len:110 (+),score=5.48 TRINITY_DN15240_c0_g3_i1:126-455(+)
MDLKTMTWGYGTKVIFQLVPDPLNFFLLQKLASLPLLQSFPQSDFMGNFFFSSGKFYLPYQRAWEISLCQGLIAGTGKINPFALSRKVIGELASFYNKKAEKGLALVKM